MTNIILCGGAGTRLWPLSIPARPKQFCQLIGEHSLFTQTVLRNKKTCPRAVIVCSVDNKQIAVEQVTQVEQDTQLQNYAYVLEPAPRNTAPALALACLGLDSEELVLVTPSDHLIKDERAYQEAVEQAKVAASDNKIVMFGIRPSYAETGYGYIQVIDGNGPQPIKEVRSFREKPDTTTAQLYCANPDYFWNSGIFCFKAGVFLRELHKYENAMYVAALRAYRQASVRSLTGKRARVITPQLEDMRAIPSNSIDYAVIEKTSELRVVPCSIGWSDLGSFDALYDEYEHDAHGNAKNNQGQQTLLLESQRNLVLSHSKKIVLLNIDDCIVVESPEAILIARRGKSQNIKKVVQELQALEEK